MDHSTNGHQSDGCQDGEEGSGGSWPVPPGLQLALPQAGGTGGAVSCGAPEPLPKLPTGQAQDCLQAVVDLSTSQPLCPDGSGHLPGLQHAGPDLCPPWPLCPDGSSCLPGLQHAGPDLYPPQPLCPTPPPARQPISSPRWAVTQRPLLPGLPVLRGIRERGPGPQEGAVLPRAAYLSPQHPAWLCLRPPGPLCPGPQTQERPWGRQAGSSLLRSFVLNQAPRPCLCPPPRATCRETRLQCGSQCGAVPGVSPDRVP